MNFPVIFFRKLLFVILASFGLSCCCLGFLFFLVSFFSLRRSYIFLMNSSKLHLFQKVWSEGLMLLSKPFRYALLSVIIYSFFFSCSNEICCFFHSLSWKLKCNNFFVWSRVNNFQMKSGAIWMSWSNKVSLFINWYVFFFHWTRTWPISMCQLLPCPLVNSFKF